MVTVTEEHMPFWQFLVRLCGIIGGIFSTTGNCQYSPFFLRPIKSFFIGYCEYVLDKQQGVLKYAIKATPCQCSRMLCLEGAAVFF